MDCTDALDDQLTQLHDLNYQVSQRLALLSMLAIAQITRSELPGAAYVSVDWSDQGPYLVPDGGYLTANGTRIGQDSAFSGDALDTAAGPYCANLGEENQGTWQAFSRIGVPGQPYHLKIDDILAADPGILAAPAEVPRVLAGHGLKPGQLLRRAKVTLTLDILICAAGTDEEVNQAVRDHLRVTSTDDAIVQVTYEAEPTVQNA